MEKGILKKYFNKQTRFPALNVAAYLPATILVFALGTPLSFVSGLVCGAVLAGSINKWQEKATGSPFWKPRTPIYGL